ncbi:(S)-ureidoglycine aminohydrolase [Candidatus Viridilinea mediisalina]|uniref:(S)-ureidoglycine aminohydrolase n=1 Tax=Candidatus Viridilinea mediisalina TaxID=2024553 RepID=A0A2A6RPU2_9CHLR|nr:(S)-ureidoglycine aminohydrolase [Candidatus Viridilinea mediisalina]PDW04946.1 (S)-ureidoglycine aminohydrolase [Candidatus Viridilinea mediisalina]
MQPLLGQTRSAVTERYALLTPDSLVRAAHPAWPGATCCVLIGPPLGARFVMLLVELDPDGLGQRTHHDDEVLLFVRSGSVEVALDDRVVALETGGFLYLPPQQDYRVTTELAAGLLLFQRRYHPLAGVALPALVMGHVHEVADEAFLGDEGLLLKTLLPATPAFDLAVNVFTFQPGATLPLVETHVMEHGLLMLEGQGIYRLGNEWYPVQAGDCIWMGPFCPQWFAALGKQPARYIYYKDVQREPWSC